MTLHASRGLRVVPVSCSHRRNIVSSFDCFCSAFTYIRTYSLTGIERVVRTNIRDRGEVQHNNNKKIPTKVKTKRGRALRTFETSRLLRGWITSNDDYYQPSAA